MRVEALAVGELELPCTAGALDLEYQRAVGEPQPRERRTGLAGQLRQARTLGRRRHRLDHRRHRPERRRRPVRGERVLPAEKPPGARLVVGPGLPADGEGGVQVRRRGVAQRPVRLRVVVIALQELPSARTAARRHADT